MTKIHFIDYTKIISGSEVGGSAICCGKTKNRIFFGPITNRLCFDCIKRRVTSTSYFEINKYKKITNSELVLIKKIKEKLKPWQIKEYDNRLSVVRIHNILPVPGCKKCGYEK